jgi:hypothetical protein
MAVAPIPAGYATITPIMFADEMERRLRELTAKGGMG